VPSSAAAPPPQHHAPGTTYDARLVPTAGLAAMSINSAGSKPLNGEKLEKKGKSSKDETGEKKKKKGFFGKKL